MDIKLLRSYMDSINGKEIKALKQELGARLNKHI